jgi:hypothetical protein
MSNTRELELADFKKATAEHKMTVVRDDGVYRHLVFQKPGTNVYRYNITTFPGHLVITGDMGTFVFNRLEDMFEFFRAKPADHERSKGLYVNFSYWAEKCDAADRRTGGLMEFSPAKFAAAVKEHFDNATEQGYIEQKNKDAIWAEIVRDVLSCDGDEADAFRAANDFESHGFYFQDFHEARVEEYTHHFQWCCYAIAHAGRTYDVMRDMTSSIGDLAIYREMDAARAATSVEQQASDQSSPAPG